MDHYIDIRVLPDPEFKESVLLNALFSKLHRALVERGNSEIGISFPAFGKTLGETLRIHGESSSLNRLMGDDWLRGLRDYTSTTSLSPVPSGVQYRTVKRLQAKSSAQRLRRRSVAKGWLSEEEAIVSIPLLKEKRLSAPYLQMKSHSTAQAFKLFVEHSPVVDKPVKGSFSAYGFSATATIPWF